MFLYMRSSARVGKKSRPCRVGKSRSPASRHAGGLNAICPRGQREDRARVGTARGILSRAVILERRAFAHPTKSLDNRATTTTIHPTSVE